MLFSPETVPLVAVAAPLAGSALHEPGFPGIDYDPAETASGCGASEVPGSWGGGLFFLLHPTAPRTAPQRPPAFFQETKHRENTNALLY